MKYNPLVRYGFDEVGIATGGTTSPTPNVDVIAKVKEEIARSSAEMSWQFNLSYAGKLKMLSFSCFKAFGFCQCNAYIQVTADFTFEDKDSLIFLLDRSIGRWYFHAPSVVLNRYGEEEHFPAVGTDGVTMFLKGRSSFEFKRYDLIVISKSFNYEPK